MKKWPEPVRPLGMATAYLAFGGRRFAIKSDSSELEAVHRQLGDDFGLVVTGDHDQPLVILRLGDFLRTCRFRSAGAIPPLRKPSDDDRSE